MMLRRAVVAGTFSLLALVAASMAAAGADQAYLVQGRDTFRTGSGEVRSETTYRGMQHLTIVRNGRSTTFVAQVDYERGGDGARQHQHASFTATLLPSGEQKDGASNDPDYLTVLNQPFAVQLDAPTMRDLNHVKRPVPFDFPSPMTGATLHGMLRRLPDALVGGNRAMGIAFEAKGPLHGGLPERPALQLAGAIRMRGTAYYAYGNALLLSLEATLSIDGSINEGSQRSPVSIVYLRSIRTADREQAVHVVPAPRHR